MAAVPASGETATTARAPVGTSVVVRGGSPEQLDLVRWAVRRFERAGLRPPALEVRFHATRSGCEGHLGYYRAGGVDLCGTNVNLVTRRNLLHEMAHAWTEANLQLEERERFLEVRGLSSWNAVTEPWQERGFEQAAEILAWYLGDRVLSAMVPHGGPEQLETAIAVLLSAASAPEAPGG
ncbi:hypothetical protein HRbin12_01682 [bacterium HR12]|nr:hypothetical protein HRbin12_01682 [bacterium HR12]